MKQGFCFSQMFISISHLCAMQHKKIGADIFCEVLHFLGLRSGCVRLFLSALRKSSVFLHCYLATVVITYDPCQIVDAFLWPLCLLLFAVCLQICFVLSSSLNQLALFFPLFLGVLLSLTTSEDWMMASNSTPSTPIFSDYAFLAFHQVGGKKYFSGPVLPGKDPSLTVLISLSVPLFLLPTLFVLALFHL